MHPNLAAFIENFEREAKRNGSYRNRLRKYERKFLEEIWGPLFQYRYDGLQPEYPLKDFKSGDRFADFVYIDKSVRLLIEIDAYTTHARDISPGDFDDHMYRQNDMLLAGFFILRFTPGLMEKRPEICKRQLMQAMGHWWMLTNHGSKRMKREDAIQFRNEQLVRFALSRNGAIKSSDVVNEYQVAPRTALNWLTAAAAKGFFEPVRKNERTVEYRIKNMNIKPHDSRE